MAETWQEIGRIESVNPARRELRVAGVPEAARALRTAEWVLVGTRPEPTRCKVESRRSAGRETVLVLAAGVPRDLIGGMRHATVSLNAEFLLAAQAGAGEETDLEGLQVVGPGGEVLGEVLQVFDQPAHPVLVLGRPDGERWLLPAIPQVILRVDAEKGVMEVADLRPFLVVEGEEEGPEDAD